MKVIAVEGYLNQLGGVALRDEIRQLLADNPQELALDFSGTRIVNSIGVSFLLEIIDAAQASRTPLEFIGVSPDINDLFKLLGIAARVPVQSAASSAPSSFLSST